MVFDIGDFYENLSRKSIFDYNQTKTSCTLHENLSAVSLCSVLCYAALLEYRLPLVF
jgi:hypothetical protein